MTKILIKDGTLVLEAGPRKADLLIEDGLIASIEDHINVKADLVLSAKNKILIPGGIDPHTHFDLPAGAFSASDSFETGTKAALWGGTTTIIDFANQTKGKSLTSAFEHWMELSKGKSYCDYGLHLSVTDVNTESLKEIEHFFHEGVTSFKTFMAYPAMKITDSDLEKIMSLVSRLGGLVTLHAELGSILEEETKKLVEQKRLGPSSHPLSHPERAEVEAVKNFIGLVEKTNCLGYVVHTSSPLSVEKHPQLYYETCPQYLSRDESLYEGPFEKACRAVMSPPLRRKEAQEGLWKALAEHKIHVLATDHCPFTLKQRERGLENFTLIPNGAPGVEDRMELFYSEGVEKRKLTLNDYVNLSSTHAAKLFGLFPKKGVLRVGSDADIVVLDPNAKWTRSVKNHHMNCDYNLYEGLEGQGKCETVILKGELAVHEGQFLLKKPEGEYLKRLKPLP